MMFMLHQFLVLRYFPLTLSTFLLRFAGGTGGIWLDITKTPHVAYDYASLIAVEQRCSYRLPHASLWVPCAVGDLI